ncbi:MAG: Orotate phosphoribosyltransferase [Firmicutes bacterium]|nr:Orotate phosphoribosyltransferase [candidate division NPL-UPA2 bacterium]
MKWLLELLLPPRPRCAICGEQSEVNVCAPCKADMAAFQHLRSAGRLGHPSSAKTIALLPFNGRVRKVIHRLKFANSPSIARSLAQAFAEAEVLPFAAVDLVTAVPMHRARYLERGYNQAELLARELATLQKLPFRQVLTRTRATPPQNTLGRAARARNVAGAFAAREDLTGRRILLVDDVYTTGNTVLACAQALYQAKAQDVVIAVVAMSLAPGQA